MGARAFWKLTDQVPRREASDEVDPLAPWAEVAEQRDERAFAPGSRLLVVVGVVASAAQKPITSRRR